MSDEIRQNADKRMKKSVDALMQALAKVRTGRAHPSLLDSIQVPYYGNNTPLSQVANVVIEDARTLSVVPWEKNMVAAVEKAIRSSDLGLNPMSAGQNIRIPLPPLTEERRRDLTKLVKNDIEDAKVAIRNIRRDANAELKEQLKAKSISQDDEHRGVELIQKLTDKYVADIDKIFSHKEAELMQV